MHPADDLGVGSGGVQQRTAAQIDRAVGFDGRVESEVRQDPQRPGAGAPRPRGSTGAQTLPPAPPGGDGIAHRVRTGGGELLGEHPCQRRVFPQLRAGLLQRHGLVADRGSAAARRRAPAAGGQAQLDQGVQVFPDGVRMLPQSVRELVDRGGLVEAGEGVQDGGPC